MGTLKYDTLKYEYDNIIITSYKYDNIIIT